jgi:hypothetical protein
MNRISGVLLTLIVFSGLSRGEGWESVTLPHVALKDATPKQALDQLSTLAREAGAYSSGFEGFIFEGDMVEFKNVTMDLRNVPMIRALGYISESGKIRFRISDRVVFVMSSAGDSIIMELNENVRKSLILPEKGPVKIEDLVSALRKRKVDVHGDTSRIVANDTAIVEMNKTNADYLRALYEVAKRGLVIEETRLEDAS